MSLKFEFDPSLILPWSRSLIQNEPSEYPFIAKYDFSSKTLVYVASLHSADLQSATFKIIQKCLENSTLDILLLEGIKHSLGQSPPTITNWALKQEQDKNYEGFETAYAVTLANKLNIPFQGCEPDESQLYTSALNHGFTSVDLLFYHFLQQCFQMNESKNQRNIEDLFKNIVKTQKEYLVFTKTPNLDEFEIWYQNKIGREFNSQNINEMELSPYANGDLFTQRISSQLCKLRDQFMIKVIESSLNSYHSVLIVCGGSHWSTQRIALQQALGSPTFSK